MNFFVVNRYEGEKEVETKDEKNHLSDLLRRIEERKQERARKCNDGVPTEDSQAVEEPPRKRRKKKRDKLENSSVVEDIPFYETIGENNDIKESVSDKKRKKKKKVIENTEDLQEKHDNKEESVEKLIDSKSVKGNVVESKNDFVILGSKTQKKKREVKRVLPDWLAHPEIVSIDLGSGPSLTELESDLDVKLTEILKLNGINKLFPIQASMISWLLKCNKDRKQGWWVRDTCVSAPTGSGKTLAYVLPIIQELQSRLVPKIRCLVVVPVQELAAQVYKVMTTYTSCTNLIVSLLSGASSFQQEQNSIYRKTGRGENICIVDIVVATPGRLVDHILKTPGFSLTELRFLVIDEADRASDWLQYLPEPHYRPPRLNLKNIRCSIVPAQKLLFSATLSQDPEKLSRLGLFQPILFTSVTVSGKDDDVNLDEEVGNFVGRYTSPEELTELAVECPTEYKPVALYRLLTKNDTITKTLVFTNSGQTAHRLVLLLRLFFSGQKVTVRELSSQLVPKQRETVLGQFSTGETQVLVCSDALARGVDIPDVQQVVSYDLPKYIKGYIHRAGRTGRAGKLGTAVSVLTPNQIGLFKHMLSNAHKVVPPIEKLELNIVADEINYQHQVEKLKELLEKEKQNILQRTKSVKRMRLKVSK